MTNAQQKQLQAIDYALAKQIPDMERRGFTIHTTYGDIEITEADGLAYLASFASSISAMLRRRRDRIAPPEPKPKRTPKSRAGASS